MVATYPQCCHVKDLSSVQSHSSDHHAVCLLVHSVLPCAVLAALFPSVHSCFPPQCRAADLRGCPVALNVDEVVVPIHWLVTLLFLVSHRKTGRRTEGSAQSLPGKVCELDKQFKGKA